MILFSNSERILVHKTKKNIYVYFSHLWLIIVVIGPISSAEHFSYSSHWHSFHSYPGTMLNGAAAGPIGRGSSRAGNPPTTQNNLWVSIVLSK
jgi:hypothetical protein